MRTRKKQKRASVVPRAHKRERGRRCVRQIVVGNVVAVANNQTLCGVRANRRLGHDVNVNRKPLNACKPQTGNHADRQTAALRTSAAEHACGTNLRRKRWASRVREQPCCNQVEPG